MNYAQIRKYDIANGEGVRTTLFVSGCKFCCQSCFNKKYQDFNYGKPFTYETVDIILQYLSDENVSGLSLLGGEIFMQDRFVLLDLLTQAKDRFPDKNVWCWTGYKLEDIPLEYHILFPYIDVLVDGQFIEELKDIRLKWRGSSNQKIYTKSDKGEWINSTELLG